MAVQQEPITNVYLAKGESRFAIQFNFLDKDFIQVFISPPYSKEKIQQTYGYDFNIVDNYVIFNEPVKADSKVYIQRNTSINNNTNFINNAKLPAGVLNFSLDKLTMICQELAEKLSYTLVYDGEEDVDYDDLIEKIIDFQRYIQNSEQLSTAVSQTAVSAAQALISAIEARQYRDTAKEYADAVVANSDIASHNSDVLSHPYIIELINQLNTALDEHLAIFNQHIADYDSFQANNNSAHQSFETDIQKLSDRVEDLENVSVIEKGNIYYAFGRNDKGQLGVNWNKDVTETPIQHYAMRNVKKVSISRDCGSAISGGRIYVTGNGANGFCGPVLQKCYGFKPHPSFDNFYNFKDIACFNETAFALTKDGKLFSWGNGSLHCLGDGTTIDRSVPRHIMPDIKFKKIAAGCRVMLALSEDGNLYSCGSSGYGALGHGVNNETNASLQPISGFDNIIDIAAGGFVSSAYFNFCAAIEHSEGELSHLYVWGNNTYGQLGLNNTTNYSSPTKIDLDFEPAKVVCGGAHIAVLSKEGAVYIAGINKALNQSANQKTLKLIESDNLFVDIAAGYNVTYMIDNYKSLYGLGTALYGCLLTNKSTATPVKLYSNVEEVFSESEAYGCAFTVAEGE